MTEALTAMLVASEGEAGLLGAYGRALARLGCRVKFWEFEAAQTRQARLGRFGNFVQRLVVVEPWLRRANRDFVIAVGEQRPDLVAIGNITRVTAGALAQIRASMPSTKLVLFWPDPLQNMGITTVQALPLYDLVATYTRSSIEPLLRLGARRVEWVPFAFDRDLFECNPRSDSEVREFACDVGFIANFRPEREETVLALRRAGIAVRVWGSDDWPRRATDKRAVAQYWQGRVLVGAEFAAATRSFRLALNVIDPTNFPGANMRFFETMGCGGTLLSSACPELAPEFPDGVAAFYYESIAQLTERVHDLLARASDRRAVAEEGRRRVLERHTYVNRCWPVLQALDFAAPVGGSAGEPLLRPL